MHSRQYIVILQVYQRRVFTYFIRNRHKWTWPSPHHLLLTQSSPDPSKTGIGTYQTSARWFVMNERLNDWTNEVCNEWKYNKITTPYKYPLLINVVCWALTARTCLPTVREYVLHHLKKNKPSLPPSLDFGPPPVRKLIGTVKVRCSSLKPTKSTGCVQIFLKNVNGVNPKACFLLPSTCS